MKAHEHPLMNPSTNPAVAEARRISRTLKPSRKWNPLTLFPGTSVETWVNQIYEVSVRRYSQGWPLGGGPWAQLGICSFDGTARHDWRDFQCIKNDVCGEEWEAIELFPKESRLVDPSNYYMLWCAPSIDIGMNQGRNVTGPEVCIAPQRGWSK